MMSDLLKGFRQMLREQDEKTPKDLMNNAPWAGFYDRSAEKKELISHAPDAKETDKQEP